MQQVDNPTADNPFTAGHREEARKLRERDKTVEKSQHMLKAINNDWARAEKAKRPKFDPPYVPSTPPWVNPK